MARSTRALLAALAIIHASGCNVSGTASPPPAAARRAQRPRSAPPGPRAPAAPAVARAPWASDAPEPDPEARRAFLLRVSQPGVRLLQGDAPPRVTALALANTAAGEAHGMRREDAIVSAKLQEGEKATVQIRIAAGECATFIAQGGLGVVEVDLFLTAGGSRERGLPTHVGGSRERGLPTHVGAGSPEILAEDPMTGPFAVIGGRGVCFPNRGAGSLSAELHVQVRRGGGVVLVEGYRRPLRP